MGIPYGMNPILIAAAVIPAAFLLIRVNKLDKLDKESPKLLLRLVIAGIISTALALATETIGSGILDRVFYEENTTYDVLMYFIVVACSEEGFKYLVLKKATWKNREFNCTFDGVVYAVFVSLGFALWENIKYVAIYGMGTAMVRAVTAVPGHAAFGVFMGVWYGMAKKAELKGRKPQCKNCQRMALLMPILVHGAYDFVATQSSGVGDIVFIGFVIGMFALALLMLNKAAKSDEFIADPVQQAQQQNPFQQYQQQNPFQQYQQQNPFQQYGNGQSNKPNTDYVYKPWEKR